MDANYNYRLFLAFHLGARAMLSLDGKQITNEQVKRLRELLIAIGSGDSTLHDPGTEAKQNPVIAYFVAQNASLPIRNDRDVAGEILQYWK
jgi:hypothetical protein